MSRDLTPREQYLVSTKLDPSYFMLNVKIKYGPTDEEKDLYTEEEKQVLLHYPIFGRAAPELLLSLKKEGNSDPEKMNVLLHNIEEDLNSYSKGITVEIDSTLQKWFDGKLDPLFYYREKNDQLFKDHLMERYPALKIEKSIKEWYCEHYPDDELGPMIPRRLSFYEAYEGLQNGIDIYTKLGPAADSIVRERIFEELTVRKEVDYNTVYQMWLDCEEEDLELDEKALEMIR